MVPSPSGEQTTAPRSGGVALSKWLLHHEFRDDADATSTSPPSRCVPFDALLSIVLLPWELQFL